MAAQDDEIAHDDRRRSTRTRTLRGATIIFNNKFVTVDCMVRDLSETGARLKVEGGVTLPDRFSIRFDHEHTERPCIMRWRSRTEVGVEFV